MIDFKTYELKIENLKLIRLDFNFKPEESISIFNDLTREEKINIEFINQRFPNTSSDYDDNKYWDIVLVDFEVLFYLENLLVKYGIVYNYKEICNLYYKQSKILNKSFIKEIDDYIDRFLNIDIVLDRINSIGIDKINKFELIYLERQSKNEL